LPVKVSLSHQFSAKVKPPTLSTSASSGSALPSRFAFVSSCKSTGGTGASVEITNLRPSSSNQASPPGPASSESSNSPQQAKNCPGFRGSIVSRCLAIGRQLRCVGRGDRIRRSKNHFEICKTPGSVVLLQSPKTASTFQRCPLAAAVGLLVESVPREMRTPPT